MATKTKPQIRENKYRVVPNLTPRGKDIMMRLKNRTLNTEESDSYTLDDEIVATSRMGRKDLLNKAMANQNKIAALTAEALEKGKKAEQAKRQKEIDEAIKKGIESKEPKKPNNGN